jgi:hypothetical protein
MGGACRTHARYEKCLQKLVGNPQRRLRRIWVTVLKWIGTRNNGVDWIDLAQE